MVLVMDKKLDSHLAAPFIVGASRRVHVPGKSGPGFLIRNLFNPHHLSLPQIFTIKFIQIGEMLFGSGAASRLTL